MIDVPMQAAPKLAERLRDDEVHVWMRDYQPQWGRQPLREVLARYLECTPGEVRFVDSPAGRPALAGPPPAPLKFNWSHSGSHALIAVARGIQPGIDLEHLKRRPRALALARRYFAPEEWQQLAALPESDVEAAFLRLWTAKEALLKAHGSGLSFGLHRVSLRLVEDQAQLTSFEGEQTADWQLHRLAIVDGYTAALGWRGPPMRVVRIDDQHM
jgi:4'-phosphopantetheinyl transferase